MCVWGGGVLRQWGVVSEDFRHQRRAPRVLRQSEGASRGFKKLGVAFRDLRQWGGVCRDFRQQEDRSPLTFTKGCEGASGTAREIPSDSTSVSHLYWKNWFQGEKLRCGDAARGAAIGSCTCPPGTGEVSPAASAPCPARDL